MANTLHSSVNALLLMERTCCGPCPQGGSLVCGSMSSCKSEFGICTILIHKSCTWEYSSCKSEFGVCTILILGTQILPNQYSHDCMSQLLLNYCLYCFFSLGTAVKLEKKKERKIDWLIERLKDWFVNAFCQFVNGFWSWRCMNDAYKFTIVVLACYPYTNIQHTI